MHVYLARNSGCTKSNTSELGCPFRDIMSSIERLIHGLGSTQAGPLMAQRLLPPTSAVTTPAEPTPESGGDATAGAPSITVVPSTLSTARGESGRQALLIVKEPGKHEMDKSKLFACLCSASETKKLTEHDIECAVWMFIFFFPQFLTDH